MAWLAEGSESESRAFLGNQIGGICLQLASKQVVTVFRVLPILQKSDFDRVQILKQTQNKTNIF